MLCYRNFKCNTFVFSSAKLQNKTGPSISKPIQCLKNSSLLITQVNSSRRVCLALRHLIHELRHHLLFLGQDSRQHSVAGGNKTTNMYKGTSCLGVEVLHITLAIFPCAELQLSGSFNYGVSGKYRLAMWPARGFMFSSVTQSCPTLCDPMDCSPLGFKICQEQRRMPFFFFFFFFFTMLCWFQPHNKANESIYRKSPHS